MRGGRWGWGFEGLTTRDSLRWHNAIKGLDVGIHHRFTRSVTHPGKVCTAALVAFGLTGPVQGEGLEALVGALLAGVQQDGRLDLTRFDCRQAVKANDSIHECRDPVSGLGFLHIRDAERDAMSVSVDKGPAGPTDTGLAVPDRAAFDRLAAEFEALGQSETLRGLTRCARPASATKPGLIVKAKPSGQVVVLGFGGLDDSSASDLDAPGKVGAVLAAIVIPVMTEFDCIPAD